MDKVKIWFYLYHNEITWFIIGFLISDGINALIHGEYLSGLLCFALAYFNYKISR